MNHFALFVSLAQLAHLVGREFVVIGAFAFGLSALAVAVCRVVLVRARKEVSRIDAVNKRDYFSASFRLISHTKYTISENVISQKYHSPWR